ncbi:MAG: hypothetical protein ACLPQ6_07370 [Steroidobacteraceae bacterium]
MREAVIVIADLYLQPGEEPHAPGAGSATLAGLEHLGRFGARSRLARGWRAWLAAWLGRAELGDLAVAQVAAAGVTTGTAGAVPTRWIATPVQLLAGLTRLHLPRGGIVRLTPPEQAALVSAFGRVFAGADLKLEPLSDGQLLLTTPGIAPLATTEPARSAGGEVRVPQGLAAAPLLRLTAEIEMWLHGEPLNELRRRRGAPAVSGLWLWGADGGTILPPRAHAHAQGAQPRAPGSSIAFGEDAWLSGLWQLLGGLARPLPERAEALFTVNAERCVAVVELPGPRPEAPWSSLHEAAAALDERLIGPALTALRSGTLGRLTLIANDTRLSVGRLSALKRWRARRPGLEAFA